MSAINDQHRKERVIVNLNKRLSPEDFVFRSANSGNITFRCANHHSVQFKIY